MTELSGTECFEAGLLEALTGKDPVYFTPVECPVDCILAKAHYLSEYFNFLLCALFASSACAISSVELNSKCLSGHCNCSNHNCKLRSELSLVQKRDRIAKYVGIEKLASSNKERVRSLVLQ